MGSLLSENDPVISQLEAPAPQIFTSFLSAYLESSAGGDSKSAPTIQAATDTLEILLRRRCIDLLHTVLVASSTDGIRIRLLRDVQLFWKSALQAVHHIVQTVEVADDVSESLADAASLSGEMPMKRNSSQCQSIAPHTSFLRRLPIVLLDDILDTLSPSLAFCFWQAVVPGSLLFSHTLWEVPNQHPCWLPFLKTANKFMRRLQAEELIETLNSELSNLQQLSASTAASKVLVVLSTVYPLSEKSATRSWGSHNTDHLTELESELEFGTETDESTTAATSLVVHDNQRLSVQPPSDYSFYETFWKLQRDFRNPSGIAVAEFFSRLKSVLNCLKSHPLVAADPSTSQPMSPEQAELLLLPYLTHSRLLPIQLTDPAIRTIFLTQLFIVARHLMSQVPPLRVQLQAHLATAESLFPNNLGSHRIERILGRSEEQWRTWKQNKFVPDIEEARKPAAAPVGKSLGKRKRNIDENEPIQNVTFDWMGSDLATVTKNMKAVVPSQKDQLEEYVEALDPESGIEAEYHPKYNQSFCWRALRLMAATEDLADFSLIHPNGDFEGMVRHIYSTKYGTEIPGQAAFEPFQDNDEEEHEEKEEDDAIDPMEETASQNDESIETKHDPGLGDDDEEPIQNGAQENKVGSSEMDLDGDKTQETVVENGDGEASGAPSQPPVTEVPVKQEPDAEPSTTEQENGSDRPSKKAKPSPALESSSPPPVAVKKATVSGNESRPREATERPRSENGYGREQPPARSDGRRDNRDFGGSSRRPDHSRPDHAWRDDSRARGGNDHNRRDDRRTGPGDSESRRDDRRDAEPRRDEWRGSGGGRDGGKDRFDRGRNERDSDRRGGRSNSGRR